jgi:hypothetical protein
MAELEDWTKDLALWRRWRGSEPMTAPAPDALTLAAYAEGRLAETEAELVEDWLAAYPQALADVAAARAVAAYPAIGAYEAIVARASALVALAGARVVPLRPTAHWRSALAWGGIAASLIGTSLVGFTMGSAAYNSLTVRSDDSIVSPDMPDSPPGLYPGFTDDSGT